MKKLEQNIELKKQKAEQLKKQPHRAAIKRLIIKERIISLP